MSSVLRQLQTGVENRLSADPYFSDIEVLTEDIGDIENKINIALAQIGICAIVITPTATVKWNGTLKPYFEDVWIIVRVVEQVVVNRSTTGTNKPAAEVAEAVAILLNNYQLFDAYTTLVLAEPTITLGNDPTYLTYDVRIKTASGIDYDVPKCGAVTIVPNIGRVITVTNSSSQPLSFDILDSEYNYYSGDKNSPISAGEATDFLYDGGGYYMAVYDNLMNVLFYIALPDFSFDWNTWSIAVDDMIVGLTPPVITQTGYRISCATAGAAVFYTTNGMHPSPRNGTLSDGEPISAASGTTIKARAWLAGYQASDEVQLIVP